MEPNWAPISLSTLLRIALAVTLCSMGFVTAHAEALQAGAAKVSIVPPFPTPMGGYFDRVATFEGVDSPIYAKALVVRNETTTLAIITTDLIAVSRELVDRCRVRIAEECGISPSHVMISATHNHSGPSGFAGSGSFGQAANEELTTFLVGQIANVTAEAYSSMRSARLGFGFGRLETLTRNRHQENDTVIDPDVGVLKVQAADSRELIATVINFTGHPVILGGNNLLISCEYPGVAAELVESALGGVALFTQGACGDITMNRTGDPFAEIQRLGRIVGAEVIKTVELTSPGDDTGLMSRFEPVQVEPRDVPAPEEAASTLEAISNALEGAEAEGAPEHRLRKLRRDRSAANTTLAVARFVAQRPDSLQRATEASVHVMQLGPLVLVGVPGELFVEYGLEMKARVRQATGRPMVLVGYANDYIGYIVTPRAAHTGGYEQAISRVAPTAGRTLTEAAMDLVDAHIPPATP